jgi:hypothetical protein
MSYILFLDDERHFIDTVSSVMWRERHSLPSFTKSQIEILNGTKIVTVRSVAEAKEYITRHGYPIMIFFDHDLGLHDPTGVDFATWLVAIDKINKCLPDEFQYYSHSASKTGRKEIMGILNDHFGVK